MILFFRGVSIRYRAFDALHVQPAGDCMYVVRLSPGDVPVFEAPTRAEAEQYVADASRAIRRGVSEGAAWVDLSKLPAYMETGIVIRGRA